jgi:mRNA-degrading endonuclease RelE of RelBE toxin-antitoxin system
MSWTVIVAKPAQKAVAKFPVKDQVKILAAIEAMADGPFVGDVTKLEGENRRWRRRVGNYRIFFTANTGRKTAEISAIVRRTSTTY